LPKFYYIIKANKIVFSAENIVILAFLCYNRIIIDCGERIMSFVDNFLKGDELDFRYVKGNTQVYSSMQFHHFCELYFFIGGNAEYVSSRSRRKLKPNQLVIIPPNAYHHFSVNRVDTSEYERCVINVYPRFPLYGVLMSAIKNKEILTFYENERLVDNIRYLMDCFENLEREDFKSVLSAVVCDIVFIIKNRQCENTKENESSKSIASKIAEYVNAHYKENLTLGAIAEKFNYSVSYLSHVFKSEFGIGIKNYILQKRLNAVQSEFLQGGKIQEISVNYGFEDYPSFFRLYKKTFGASPSETKKTNNTKRNTAKLKF
jgi:AraC-like DNA-binding protein